MARFLGKDFNDTKQKMLNSENTSAGFSEIKSSNSMLGTIFTVSPTHVAGLSESVITPGIRMLKFTLGIVQISKRLSQNLNTITSKLKRVTDILNGFSSGKYNHIRNSVIKMKTKTN